MQDYYNCYIRFLMYKEAIALRHNTVIVALLFKDPSQPLLFQMPPKLLILYGEAESY